MTLKQAKETVKAIYPKAVCCTVWDGHWHLVIKSRRHGEDLCDPISVKTGGNPTQAWKAAASELAALSDSQDASSQGGR